jgi:phosphoribosylformimino-5-aminoimidazole carboxamide ribotide isomerase
MEIIPAIDIRGGKCVRLYQGDYEKETVYSENPLDVARTWEAQGASRLHIVDLDGAKKGIPVNLKLVEKITSLINIPVQLGGGIRTLESALSAIGSGVSRIIIGTAAAENSHALSGLCQEIGPDSLIVSIDTRGNKVAVRGWTQSSNMTATELVQRVESVGIQRFVYTDVSRDGTLTEPNFDSIRLLLSRTQLKMLVAGGISSVKHLKRISDLGAEGAIVGKAAYTGEIDICDAIQSFNQSAHS